jgi:hypothetical protein
MPMTVIVEKTDLQMLTDLQVISTTEYERGFFLERFTNGGTVGRILSIFGI